MLNKKSLLPIVLVPACLLAIPAAAMFFQVEGWAWSPGDFVLMGLLLAGAVAAYLFVASFAPNTTYRRAAAVGATTGVVLLWINGAVGLIGSEENPANVLYAGVILVGLAGATAARLRPQGMSWTMFAMAAAQFLVPLVGLIFWAHDFSPGVLQVFVLNFGFVVMFAVSGMLFRVSGAGAGSGSGSGSGGPRVVGAA